MLELILKGCGPGRGGVGGVLNAPVRPLDRQFPFTFRANKSSLISHYTQENIDKIWPVTSLSSLDSLYLITTIEL
jgi:hypothetical protein